jgi:hypothetical protein
VEHWKSRLPAEHSDELVGIRVDELLALLTAVEAAENVRDDSGIEFEDSRLDYRSHQISRLVWDVFLDRLNDLSQGAGGK